MKWITLLGVCLVCAGLVPVTAQAPAGATEDSSQSASGTQSMSAASSSPVPLEWTPPALDRLNTQAAVKSSFTLDRNLLGMAAGMVPDSEAEDRQVIRKLDGVSVHTMRFGDAGIPDEAEVDSIRAAYHLRGWKHLVTTTKAGGPVRNGTTDVWVVMDGINVRGAVILAETPKSLTLVTVAGNLSPVDLLHLRGHFGIPRFEGGSVGDLQ
jgi:hypothetical protein